MSFLPMYFFKGSSCIRHIRLLISYKTNQTIVCLSVAGVGMDNIPLHVDPRKQELLEARFLGGRVCFVQNVFIYK